MIFSASANYHYQLIVSIVVINLLFQIFCDIKIQQILQEGQILSW